MGEKKTILFLFLEGVSDLILSFFTHFNKYVPGFSQTSPHYLGSSCFYFYVHLRAAEKSSVNLTGYRN